MTKQFKEYEMFSPLWYAMLNGGYDRSKGQHDNPYSPDWEKAEHEAYQVGWEKEDYWINKKNNK